MCGQVWCQWGLYQAATLGPCEEAGWLAWLGGLVTCHPSLLLLSCAMAANQLYTLLQLGHQLRQVQGGIEISKCLYGDFTVDFVSWDDDQRETQRWKIQISEERREEIHIPIQSRSQAQFCQFLLW